MPHHVVVVLLQELSKADAERVTALNGSADRAVSYHLLLADGAHSNGASALLGIERADTFGSPAVARRAGAEDNFDTRPDTNDTIANSVDRLRAAQAADVDFAVTHTDLWSGARSLVRSTDSDQVIVVADSRTYQLVSLFDWQRRARAYLNVDTLYTLQHQH
ncbi:hypothetical protein [Kribbella sp. CA-247076]|uniref:hypothetical protein n=1 Tax=Kribbella sp. CA-247076 TaxID=3239941 RepID=UPI003D91100B